MITVSFMIFKQVMQVPIVDQYCNCGLKSAVRQVQKNGPNFGRTYQACPKPRFEDRCQFFQFCGAFLDEEKQDQTVGIVTSDDRTKIDKKKEQAVENVTTDDNTKKNWVECKSSGGHIYYHNRLSGVSQWKKP